VTIVWGSYRDDLVSDFADACDAVLGPLPDVWLVTAGLRTIAQQAALYARGRTSPGDIVTYAKPGSSAHNYGLAIDVGLSGPGGQSTWDFDEPGWERLWNAVRASPTLHSGEDFPSGEQDPDHIQRFDWQNFKPVPSQQVQT
jgi:D-alanyl-D-alanine carboxypeptidase